MSFNNITLYEDDFDFFIELDDISKLEYLYDALTDGTEAAFINQLHKADQAEFDGSLESIADTVQVHDYVIGPYRLCVTQIPGKIQLNSDNLRILRTYARNLMLNGAILVNTGEKKHPDFDTYKYFKSYDIIGTAPPLCEN